MLRTDQTLRYIYSHFPSSFNGYIFLVPTSSGTLHRTYVFRAPTSSATLHRIYIYIFPAPTSSEPSTGYIFPAGTIHRLWIETNTCCLFKFSSSSSFLLFWEATTSSFLFFRKSLPPLNRPPDTYFRLLPSLNHPPDTYFRLQPPLEPSIDRNGSLLSVQSSSPCFLSLAAFSWVQFFTFFNEMPNAHFSKWISNFIFHLSRGCLCLKHYVPRCESSTFQRK